ncbi:MAG: DUF885 domain-containing protein [Hyphomonadaceae bacterium]|nr:DUF885 domain-containing protein [Hyphomonadaceae bacterium]
MRLLVKILLGLVALVVVAVLGVVTWFYWAPVGVNNYANRVAIDMAFQSPQALTQLGVVDNTLLDFHSAKLDDYTKAGDDRMLALAKNARAGLDRYGPKGLKGQEALSWSILAATFDDMVRSAESPIAQAPYRINQISGVTIDGPAFLTDMHQIVSKASAEKYVKRIVEFGRVLGEVKARVEADRAVGITPPDFIIDKALAGMHAFIDGGAANTVLVTTFAPKLDAIKLGDADKAKLVADATAAVDAHVIPGYEALIVLFEDMRKTATHDAGIWRVPGGEQFYAGRLRAETTTDLTADEIHEIGLAEAARIEAEMTAVMDRMGVAPGEFMARVDSVMKDPAQLYPNTDAGREEMLTYLRGLKAGFDAKSKDWFQSLPKQALEIVRVPEYAQDSSAGGYYNPPSLDGSRPGRFYINLRNTADYPKFTLATLFYHEAEPGHHFQLSAAQNVKDVPIQRQVISPAAFSEGWGLYAEKLAKEMGFYETDLAGDLGRLQSEMFRATRLVVDTGMHAERWSREQAIDYMRSKTGMTEEEITREVERYVAWPGQACAYKIGELTILRLREHAKSELGDKFDIRAFHEEVLMNGGMPLNVLEQVIDQWIADGKSAAPPA